MIDVKYYSASNYMDVFEIILIIMQIKGNYTKSTEGVCMCSEKTWKCFSVVTQHLIKPLGSSSESKASRVNCVTVSDTDASLPPRMKAKFLTKLTRTSCTT